MEGTGLRIKELRKQKMITQSELAKIAGVSTSAIGMYEQEKRNPEYNTLIKLSDYFEVSIDYLLKGKEENSIDDKLKKLLEDEILVAFEDYENWSEEDKKELISYLNAKKITRK